MSRDEWVQAHRDGVELLASREAVGRAPADPARDLMLQGGDFDHAELVHIRAHDREEAQPREERRLWVLGQREHPRVEFERAQERVDELLGCRDRRVEDLGRQRRDPELAKRQPAALVRAADCAPVLGGRRRRERRRRPLRHELGARGERQGRERRRLAEHRRADPRHDRGWGEPLQAARWAHREVAAQPPYQPHLDGRPLLRRRDDAEQAGLAFGVAEEAAHGPPASLLAAALLVRQPQLRAVAVQGHPSLRERHHGDAPPAGGEGSSRLRVRRVTKLPDPVSPLERDRDDAVAPLEPARESRRRDERPGPAPQHQLVEHRCGSGTARGHRIVREDELGQGQDREASDPQVPIHREFELEHEPRGINQGLETASRWRAATEDVVRLELGDARRIAGHRADGRVDRQPAPALHVEPHPAPGTPAAEIVLRRVEVEIPVEAAPRRPAQQTEWERRCEQRVQALAARDVPAELGHGSLRGGEGGVGTRRSRRAPPHPPRWHRRARRGWSSS